MKSLYLYFYCCCCHITLTLISEITSLPSSPSQNEMSQFKSTDKESNINPIPSISQDTQNSSLFKQVNSSNMDRSRRKRNIGQLAYLIHFHTPYNWKRLLNYGNWCGLGGNRAGDFSVIDLCDNCCKQHDLCYHFAKQAMDTQQGPLIFLPVFGISLGSGSNGRSCNPYSDFYSFSSVPDPFLGGSVPYCVDVYGSCARRVCHCDVEFVKCLRRSRCRAL